MTVYVDDAGLGFGRMKMCHMLADSDEELHAMADKIGVARKWHQAPPEHDSHYDICLAKRRLALKMGAIPVQLRVIAMMNRRRAMEGKLGSHLEAEDWYRWHKSKSTKPFSQT